MNRIDRLTAILTHLQSKRTVKAQTLSDRFQVSLRTIYRDIRSLEEAGVPIIGEAGQGYSLVDGYRLPPVMFTSEEATAFVLAEKIVENISDPSTMIHFRNALIKLRSVLPQKEKDLTDQMDNVISIRKTPYSTSNASKPQSIPVLLEAITQKKLCQLHYAARGNEVSERLIEPLGVYYHFDQWYLVAFCQLRADYRTFRIDRFVGLSILQECFEPNHFNLQEYLDRIKENGQLSKIVCRVDQEVWPYLAKEKYDYGLVDETTIDDKIQMTFLVSREDDFARWFIMVAEYADLISPSHLREYVKEKILLKLRRTDN